MSLWAITLNIFGVLIATLILIRVFLKRRFTYWRNLGVDYEEPKIPVGNVVDSSIPSGELFARFYNRMKKRKAHYAGFYIFYQLVFVPIDLDLVKRILQVDFTHFMDHGLYYNEKDDPLTAHIFALSGQRWRNLRTKLTPTFTSGKMKNMFPIIVKISQELVKVLEADHLHKPIETKDIAARLTTDIIGNCAFGIECNSLKDPNTEFRTHGKRLFDLSKWEFTRTFLTFLCPDLMRFFRARFFPKVATDFFWNVIKETTEYREKNGIRRNDALQLLIDMKNDPKEQDLKLTFRELAAQAFVFFIAGFDTSSSLISFAMFELALNQIVQDRLRDEVNAVLERNNDELSYEVLADLNYCEMVIYETLRKYPPIPSLTRVCTKDYKVPNTDLIIKEGWRVFIPIQGIHNDPEIYPDPDKFDPHRFTEEYKSKRHQFAFLPFGEGPRICLGIRFAMMQTKMSLAMLVRNFRFKVNPKTEIPLKYDPMKFFLSPLGGLWVDLEKIE